jgi:hypothetical protein
MSTSANCLSWRVHFVAAWPGSITSAVSDTDARRRVVGPTCSRRWPEYWVWLMVSVTVWIHRCAAAPSFRTDAIPSAQLPARVTMLANVGDMTAEVTRWDTVVCPNTCASSAFHVARTTTQATSIVPAAVRRRIGSR